MSLLEEKIKDAEETLRLATEMSGFYYHKPLIICYSGGKDSDVMLHIAKNCLNKDQFEVLNSHTTVDAPETVYHIRDVFKQLDEEGIKATIQYPTDKDGKRITMWRLIEDKGIPPTRIMRYCCDVLKEASTPNRMASVGVRESESVKRRGRGAFSTRSKKRSEQKWQSSAHVHEQFEASKKATKEFGLSDSEENVYDCKFIASCKNNKDTIVQPIYSFTDKDIWDYVKTYDVPMNPLYAKGYKRVGCVGCPLGGGKHQRKEFLDYPKYKENYIKAFDRMLKKREERGMKILKYDFKTGEEVYRWWIGENPKQIRIEDLLEE